MTEKTRAELLDSFKRQNAPDVPPGVITAQCNARTRFVQVGQWRVYDPDGSRKERDMVPGVRANVEALFRGMGVDWLSKATGFAGERARFEVSK